MVTRASHPSNPEVEAGGLRPAWSTNPLSKQQQQKMKAMYDQKVIFTEEKQTHLHGHRENKSH